MKSRTALNIVAFVLAIIAGISVFVYTSSADRRAIENLSPTPVVVSNQEIPAGTTLGLAIDQGWLEVTNVPQRSFPQGALQSVDATNRSMHLLQQVSAGQILFSANLVDKMPQIGPLTIPNGLMAVTVELSDPARVSPFLRAGAEVAIFNTVQLEATQSGLTTSTTKIVLDRVTVLGIGATTVNPRQDNATNGEQGVPLALVTLAVTQSQAEVLVHSAQTGALYFALLRDGTVVSNPRTITDSQIFGKS